MLSDSNMEIKDSKLQEYEDYLKMLAAENSDTIVSNGGKDHAVILYSVLLDNTERQVRIFCQSGDSAVWKDSKFTSSLRSFLDRSDDVSLHVLTAHEPALSREWTDSYKEKVEAFQIPAESKEKIYKHFRNNKCNFAVFDEKRYRYEYDCNAFRAYGSFNSPETSRQMIDLFDEAFSAASGIH